MKCDTSTLTVKPHNLQFISSSFEHCGLWVPSELLNSLVVFANVTSTRYIMYLHAQCVIYAFYKRQRLKSNGDVIADVKRKSIKMRFIMPFQVSTFYASHFTDIFTC